MSFWSIFSSMIVNALAIAFKSVLLEIVTVMLFNLVKIISSAYFDFYWLSVIWLSTIFCKLPILEKRLIKKAIYITQFYLYFNCCTRAIISKSPLSSAYCKALESNPTSFFRSHFTICKCPQSRLTHFIRSKGNSILFKKLEYLQISIFSHAKSNLFVTFKSIQNCPLYYLKMTRLCCPQCNFLFIFHVISILE